MNYKELIVWQKSFKLSVLIYKLTEKFPSKERFGLTDQMRRAGVSVPSNIAEGYARASKKYFNNFIKISLGSVSELETQLLLSIEIGYLEKQDAEEVNGLIIEVQKMLGAIIRKS